MQTTLSERLQKGAGRSTVQVTHIGRKSGKEFQVTTWFIVEGEKVLLPTSNIDRNWTRNVRKTPHVELTIRSERFAGNARFVESERDRAWALAAVKRKYAVALAQVTTRNVSANPADLLTFAIRRAFSYRYPNCFRGIRT